MLYFTLSCVRSSISKQCFFTLFPRRQSQTCRRFICSDHKRFAIVSNPHHDPSFPTNHLSIAMRGMSRLQPNFRYYSYRRFLHPNITYFAYTNSIRYVSQSVDQKKKRVLTYATYFSCAIGVVLISVIGAKEYQKLKRRARGVQQIEEPLLGRRQYLYTYRGFVYDQQIADNIDNIHHFKVRDDDVWVLTFPKAGTTWMEEIVYLIMNGLDLEKARSKNMEERVPFFEYVYPGFKAITAMESPRIIKSHLPMSFLPKQMKEKKPKIVYVARNPKDTVVSYYHFVKMLKLINYSGSLDDFVNRFVEDRSPYSPWSKHVLQAWQQKDQENILFIKYEDMKRDISSVIQQVALFLGKPLTSDEIKLIVKYTSFDNMKKNPASNYSWMKGWAMHEDKEFLRKGIVGDWKSELNAEQIKKINTMVEDKLQNTSLVFEDQ